MTAIDEIRRQNPGSYLPTGAELAASYANKLVTEQPDPVKNENPAVWDLVMKDMADRDKEGYRKYQTRLQPFNGRDALVDAYQETIDAVVYLRQVIYERDKK